MISLSIGACVSILRIIAVEGPVFPASSICFELTLYEPSESVCVTSILQFQKLSIAQVYV